MSLINIKQLRNLPNSSQGAIIVYNGNTNVWSNQDNGAILISVGNSAQRPVSAVNGLIRYNSSSNLFEFYENGNWRNLDKVELTSLGISGESLFEYVSGNSEIYFKTIQGNGIVDVYTLSGTIYVSANAIKEINVSSLGTGEIISDVVSGSSEILMKTISEGGIISVYTSSDYTLIVSANAIKSVSALGGGTSIVQSVSAGREIMFRTISDSSDVLVQTSGNEIYFRTRNQQVSAITGDLSEPLLFTIATAKASSRLSVETTNIIFARSGAYAANSVIFFSGITAAAARIPIPYNSRIIRVTGNITANTGSIKTISLFVGGTEYTNILEFPVTAVSYYSYNTNVNITVNAGEGISAIVRGGTGNISNVSLCIWLKTFLPG